MRRANNFLLFALLCLSCRSGDMERLPPQEIVQLDAKLDRWYPPNEPGAVVLLVQQGKILYRSARGLADMARGRPLATDMSFRIGSLTKQFTAAAILKLTEEGKLRLQDPISAYFDKLPPTFQAITIEQLLTHTSGLPNYTEQPAYQENKHRWLQPDEIWHTYILGRVLEFPPGTKFKYSNTGYLLLGMVIEQVTGMSYPAFLQERFLAPLGLTHTHYDDHVERGGSMPVGYLNPSESSTSESSSSEGGAFGLVSTSDDLVRWTQALHSGRVLAPASLSKMLSHARLADGTAVPYGLGLSLRTSQGHSLAGHSGRIDGFSAFLEIDLQTGAIAVILSNTSEMQVDHAYFSRYLLALATEQPLKEIQPAKVPLFCLQRISGLYAIEKEIRIVSYQDGRVFSRKFGRPRFEMLPISETEFGYEDTDNWFRFELSKNSVTGCRGKYGDEPESPFQPKLEAIQKTFPIAEQKVREWYKGLRAGNLNPATFSADLLQNMIPSRLQPMSDDMRTWGELRRMTCYQRLTMETGRTRYVYRLDFEQGTLNLMLWLNSHQRIDEFYFHFD